MSTLSPFADYEARLDHDREWAMSEGSRHFEGRGAVYETLRRIVARLDELGVSYAVAGGMALFAHGLRRFTEDVDILVAAEGLAAIHQALEGRGYRPPYEGSRNLRDSETGVRIEFLVTGQFPGDGKPKPVAFPSPAEVSWEQSGIRYVNLPTLVQLKLASGQTHVGRLKDLADVQELIKTLALPESFADGLDAFVQETYRQLWRAAQADRAES